MELISKQNNFLHKNNLIEAAWSRLNKKHPISNYCVRIRWRFCIHQSFQYFVNSRLWIISQSIIWMRETMWFRHRWVLEHSENRFFVAIVENVTSCSFSLCWFLGLLQLILRNKVNCCEVVCLYLGFSNLLVSSSHSKIKASFCLFPSFQYKLLLYKPFYASYSSRQFALFFERNNFILHLYFLIEIFGLCFLQPKCF